MSLYYVFPKMFLGLKNRPHYFYKLVSFFYKMCVSNRSSIRTWWKSVKTKPLKRAVFLTLFNQNRAKKFRSQIWKTTLKTIYCTKSEWSSLTAKIKINRDSSIFWLQVGFSQMWYKKLSVSQDLSHIWSNTYWIQVLNHPYVMIITNAGSSITLVYSVICKQLFFTKKPELNQTEKQNIHSFLY